MKRVHIRRDPFDTSTWTTTQVDDVCAYLSEQFDLFPAKARIYHETISITNDVTPSTELAIQQLQALEGEFYVVVYPEYGAFEIAMFVVWAVTAAFSIYTYMTMPKPPTGVEQPSSNNELSSRVNKMRMNSRVPEIFGKVRAIPDLIAPPLRYFKNNVEIEECLMCLGRGYYDVSNIRDGSTDIQQIDGISVSIYEPLQNLTTSAPQYRYGDVLSHPPLVGNQSKSITGQTLLNPNSARVVSSDISFGYPNIIYVATNAFENGETVVLEGAKFGVQDTQLSGTTDIDLDFTLTVASSVDINEPENFKQISIASLLVTDPEAGVLSLSGNYEVLDIIKSGSAGAWVYEIVLNEPQSVNQNFLQISEPAISSMSATLTDNIGSMDLDGTYSININDGSKITLSAPDSINPDWLKLENWGNTRGIVVGLYGTQENWLGWYETESKIDQIYANFFAPSGLYHIGTKGYKEVIGVQLELEYQRIDDNAAPVGSIYKQTQVLWGDPAGIANSVGLSITGSIDTASRIRFRLRRATVHTSKGTVVDEVQARSVFLLSTVNKLVYEDVTLVRTVTITNDISAGVSSREMNMLATRKLPRDGSGELVATRSAAQALIYLALDSKNGRRSLSEVDIAQIVNEEQSAITYFNSSSAVEFSYTIDDSNLSFEEISGMVCSAMFCEPYRFGSKLQIEFEKPQENAVLLFNHRNKVPKSEKRSFSLGVKNAYDGVELEYTSPIDDVRVKYVASDSEQPKNLKEIKTTGIRNEMQAKIRAWREWNKIKHQHISCQFDALDESEILRRNDKILVANQTRTDTQDGEVLAADGLMLTLSQNIEFNDGEIYFIYLQMSDGTVDSIQIAPGAMTNQVILQRAPVQPLVVDKDMYLKTVYIVMRAEDEAYSAFMMTELKPQGKMTNSLTCVNYTPRYYEKDHDFF